MNIAPSWLPMGSAPRDRAILLLFAGSGDDPDAFKGAIEGEWHQGHTEADPLFDCWLTFFGTFGDYNLPIGWMNLPES